MTNLLIVLLVLLICLAVVVKLTERYGKPLEPARLVAMRRTAMLLLAVLVVLQILFYFLQGN